MTDVSPSALTPRRRLETGLDRLSGRWGYFVAFGLLLVVLGALALGMVVSATIASVLVIGVFMTLTGLAEIAIGLGARDWGRLAWWVGTGLLYAIAGVIAIARPGLAAAVFTLMLGAGLVATGVLRLFLAFHLPKGGSRPLVLLSAIVTILFGAIIVLGWPENSLVVLGVLLGIDLIFVGAGWLGLGLAMRRRAAA